MAITGEMQQYRTDLDSPNWRFDGAANQGMYTSYTPSDSAAVAVPCVNYSGQNLPLFYVGSGTVTFTVYGQSGGEPSSMTGSDTYVGPDLNTWDHDTDEWHVVTTASGASFLNLGSPIKSGVQFEADVTLPEDDYQDGAGQIFFCQLLTGATHDFQGPDSRRVYLPVSGALLDGSFPYENQSASGGADAAVQLAVNDNPRVPLPPANCYSVHVALIFELHLMYQSSSDLGAIPVSMASRTWSTSVIAIRPPESGQWEILEQDVFVSPYEEAWSLPIWNGNTATLAADLKAQLQAVFGGQLADIAY